MIKPFTMVVEQSVSQPQQTNTITNKPTMSMMDFSSLQNITSFTQTAPIEPEKKKKGGRPRKNTGDGPALFTAPPHMGEVITDSISEDGKSKRDLTFLETNESYETKYMETNAILRSAIAQLDAGIIDIQGDIDDVRSAKTLRNKFNNLSLLQSNLGSYISNKIAAARELNNTIAKCNDMELKRYKEMKASAAADQDDDQRIMEMYKAFVNVPAGNAGFTPIGSAPSTNVMGPSLSSMTLPSNNLIGAGIGSADAQYNQYLQNLTPSQNMMLLESDPNIQQVVVYNQETGARYFEVMNIATGDVVPNAEKHDAMFLEDVTIDLTNKVARNINLGETYPLVVVGQPITDEY